MIPLRRGVRGPNRGPFASLPLSYFLLQTYSKSSFEECNSLPKILQRVPRKSYWARLNRYSIACFDEFSADISSKELSSPRITVDGFLRRRSYKKIFAFIKSDLGKTRVKLFWFPISLFASWLLIYKRVL